MHESALRYVIQTNFMEVIFAFQQEQLEPMTMSSRNIEVYIACLVVCAFLGNH